MSRSLTPFLQRHELIGTRLAWAVTGFVFLALVVTLFRSGQRPKGYPPGPPTLPIIGNLHQFPRKDFHVQFQKWTQEYGPVVSLKLGNQTMILLGSATSVNDLLEKKGSIYSTRLDTFYQEFGEGLNIAFRKYDDVLRRFRKVYAMRLTGKLANNYLPYQYFETSQLLYEVLNSPENFMHHLERFTISIGSTIAFGKRIPSSDIPQVKTLMEWFRRAVLAGGKIQVADWWPFLRPFIRIIPKFVLPLKGELDTLYHMEVDLWANLTSTTREQMRQGRFVPSLCRDMIAQAASGKKDALNDREILYNSGHAWAAATDTQSNTLNGFVKAMVLFPQVQAKAWAEINRVIGSDRLPEWSDRDSLPYMRRCVEETLRWCPPTITGGPMPHCVSKTDTYMGYVIPAGAGVINCVWTINNDPSRYPNPREFDPERYSEDAIAPEGISVSTNYSVRPHVTFGAGRRICPGSYVAERTLFIAMCRLIWAFKFDYKRDASGHTKPIDRDAMTEGLVVGPAPFECDIKPRDEKRIATILKMYAEMSQHLDQNGNYKDEFFKKHWSGKNL
ncbi:putative cytochrome P450 [Pyrenochaeta sp. DS3sAY3a]|nr:putative cytochrome P450 [Pyrenochaeta sp. DS3sAY3a]